MAERNPYGGRVYHRSAKPRKGVARTFGESADYSDHQGCEALYTNKPLDLLKCLRPAQWAKNLLLLAAPFFAFFDKACAQFAESVHKSPMEVVQTLALAVVAFILLSGSAYISNDLVDAKRDAKHPLKKQRPIAARKVSPLAAVTLDLICCIGGLALAGWLSCTTGKCGFFVVAGLYVLLQPLYTFVFRKLKDVGEIMLAMGFVLRAVAGAVVVDVRMSSFFLLCIFVAALFVALCKRRSEHFVRNTPQVSMADARILDLEIGATAALTVASYAVYVLMTTNTMIYTIPWVILGIFRYLRLTYGEQRAGTPEDALLRDPVMLVCWVGWILTSGHLLHFFS